MVNSNKLKAAIRRARYSNAEVANALGINESTLYRKLDRDCKSFTVREANDLAKLLHLSIMEIHEIFFCD